MNIAIMGSGAIGSYLGARLTAAGNQVLFIARGAQLAALKNGGLKLLSPLGDVTLDAVDATDDPKGRSPVDLVVFTVKGYDTADAAALIAPLVGPRTGILNLQNGVEGIEILAAQYSKGNVLPGTTMVSGRVEEPGVVRHFGKTSAIVTGEWDGGSTDRLDELRSRFDEAGIHTTIHENIHAALWSKLVAMASASALTCLTRLPLRTIATLPETRDLVLEAMGEVIAVANARGIEIGADLKSKILETFSQQDPDWKTSMCNDLEAGRRIEIVSISGAVHRFGAELGVQTPIHSFAYRALKSYADQKH